MCQERTWNLIAKQVIVPTWYMRHVFKDFRGSWRCLSFAKTKKKKYKSQAEVARTLNLQRASARAAATRNQTGGDKSRWMFKSFSALYCNSEKRFMAKDSFTKMKNLINSSFESREAALSPSSSMNELIPTALDFDLENALMSNDSSDLASTGAPPSRRSSGSFYYAPTPDTTCAVESGLSRNSPYQCAKHQRRKRATVVREVKNSSTSSGGQHGVTNHAAALAERVTSQKGRETENRTRKNSDNVSISACLTMDTAASTPCRSISTAGWLENYDLTTESLSSWTPSEKANSVIDVPSCTPSQRSFSGPLPFGGGPPALARRDQHLLTAHHQKKPSSVPSLSQRPPSIASSVADYTEQPRRSNASIAPSNSRVVSSTQQKDFQEAIVDIILENDVNDLVDLEEFLQGYFRLNTLYQDIIQQFFNDLSKDLVHPTFSRAPTVFARLASAHSKSATATKAFSTKTKANKPTNTS